MKRRLPLEPRAAMALLKAESTAVFRRLKLGPREFFNKANRYRAAAVLPNEIADALAMLTNFDVVAEDPVGASLVLTWSALGSNVVHVLGDGVGDGGA